MKEKHEEEQPYMSDKLVAFNHIYKEYNIIYTTQRCGLVSRTASSTPCTQSASWGMAVSKATSAAQPSSRSRPSTQRSGHYRRRNI